MQVQVQGEEEVEEFYGFGTYSDMFHQSQKKKSSNSRMNTTNSPTLLNSFWMMKKDLATTKQKKKYYHIAIKWNGTNITGYNRSNNYNSSSSSSIVLGTIFLQEEEKKKEKQLIWIQQQGEQPLPSPSPVVEQLQGSLLQDITNRPKVISTNSSSTKTALCIPIKSIQKVEAIELHQNKVQGIQLTFQNTSKDTMELCFLPGPFSKQTARNELMETIQEQLKMTSSSQVREQPKQSEQSMDIKSLVRQYIALKAQTKNEFTDQAIELAKKIYQLSNGLYYIGPMNKTIPKFASNALYRREMIDKLSFFLEKMNLEWKQKDQLLAQQTHTKFHTIQETGQIVYYDFTTKQQITPQEYATRYLQFYPFSSITTITSSTPSRLLPKEEEKDKMSTSSMLLSSEDSEWVFDMLSCIGLFKKKDTSTTITSFVLDDFFLNVMQLEMEKIESSKEKHQWFILTQVLTQLIFTSSTSTSSNKQPKQQYQRQQKHHHHHHRRKSILLPNEKELEQFRQQQQQQQQQQHKEEEQKEESKKRPMVAGDINKSFRRQKRRQSIVGQVILPSTILDKEEEEEEEVKEATVCTLGESNSVKEDTSMCQLCFSEMANVSLRPCGHSMCLTCWKRLEQVDIDTSTNENTSNSNTTNSSSSSTSSSNSSSPHGVLCPWDRELVVMEMMKNL